MMAKLIRMTHKIVIQPHLVAESCTICSSCSRRPVQKLLDVPSYMSYNMKLKPFTCKSKICCPLEGWHHRNMSVLHLGGRWFKLQIGSSFCDFFLVPVGDCWFSFWNKPQLLSATSISDCQNFTPVKQHIMLHICKCLCICYMVYFLVLSCLICPVKEGKVYGLEILSGYRLGFHCRMTLILEKWKEVKLCLICTLSQICVYLSFSLPSILQVINYPENTSCKKN